MCPKIKEKRKKKKLSFDDYKFIQSINTIERAGINVYDDKRINDKTKRLKDKGLIKIGKNNTIKITKKGKKYVK